MDNIKIVNFNREHQKIDFPNYLSLSSKDALKIQEIFKKKILGNQIYDALSLVEKIDSLGCTIEGENAESIGFSITKILILKSVKVPGFIYLNWYRYDKIDKISLKEIEKYFLDIWYPELDDIDIFDDSFSWILSITHFGCIKFLKI